MEKRFNSLLSSKRCQRLQVILVLTVESTTHALRSILIRSEGERLRVNEIIIMHAIYSLVQSHDRCSNKKKYQVFSTYPFIFINQ